MPSRPKRSAMARPMPLAPPVTTATFPSRSRIRILLACGAGGHGRQRLDLGRAELAARCGGRDGLETAGALAQRVGSGGGSLRARAISTFIGLMIMKKITAATVTKLISLLMKSPYLNTLPLISNVRALKSGLPKIAAISGVTRSSTTAVTTAVNARPMTTATASSTRLPRNRNVLNSPARLLMSSSVSVPSTLAALTIIRDDDKRSA